MNDYTDFEVEDFLVDENFIKWVKTPNDISNQLWNSYIINHPGQKRKIELAIATIKSFTYPATNLPETFYSLLKQDIDITIANNVPVKKLSPAYKLNTWMKVAAAIIVIAASVSMLYVYLQPSATIKIVTAYKQVKTFELPDHSLVTLNANSSLEYPKEWNNDKREVTLNGEGFFKITHIEKTKGAAKFTVHANAVNIEVLGTEFNVRNREDVTGVMLQSGRVQLRIKESDAVRVMKPNDFISFNLKTKEVNSQTVNPTFYTAWLNHKYLFSKVTLEEVCNHLEDFYDLKFTIENAVLAKQEISGTLLLEDEPSLLQTLSSFLNANIKQQGQQITISSK
ncbi:MAG: FecR family protein [Segetibacter sp.]